MDKYKVEAAERWGNTEAYKEYKEKTSDYTEEKHKNAADGLNSILEEFSYCKAEGNSSDSSEAQGLVKELQRYITANYYTCTNEILKSLGAMYTADERFRQNIDKHGEGTAEFIKSAIDIYCK